MTESTANIITTEWRLFDQVQNIGGRAACQDDRKTFFIMRSSQLEAWNREMRASYDNDLLAAVRAGRNPISEKYAYMMERTDPQSFAEIRDKIPPRTPEKDALIDNICQAHITWLEQLSQSYPQLVGRGRALRREADSKTVTSFETYLWGELATYSLHTLTLYAAYVEQLWQDGRNMNEMILQNTIRQYGFLSLEAAEAKLGA